MGLEKNFGDVAIPKLIAATVRIGVRKNGDGAIAGAKFEEKRFRGPQKANFRFALRIGMLALPVATETQRPRGFPLRGRREAFGVRDTEQGCSGGCE